LTSGEQVGIRARLTQGSDIIVVAEEVGLSVSLRIVGDDDSSNRVDNATLLVDSDVVVSVITAVTIGPFEIETDAGSGGGD